MNAASISSASLSQANPQLGMKIAKQNQQSNKSNVVEVVDLQPKAQQETKELAEKRVVLTKQLEESQAFSQDELAQLVERLDEFVSALNTGLSFRVDEESGKNVVTVYEANSGKVIRQIPEKEMLELAEQLSSHTRGLLTEKA